MPSPVDVQPTGINADPTLPPGLPPALLPGPTAAASGLTDTQATTIYSLVAHDLVEQSLATATSQTMPAFIGINPRAGEGPLLDTDATNGEIPPDLIDNLADLRTTVTFSSFMDAIGSLDDGGVVRDNGIYLALGVLESDGPDRVRAYASYYRGATDATGYQYTLSRSPGGPWSIEDRQIMWDH
ncbi:MAG TPA: hypothetical protein VM536_08950 [Chloroflexia bacterium]|nr:hypothetical protein [Chloroflexia bacterium]